MTLSDSPGMIWCCVCWRSVVRRSLTSPIMVMKISRSVGLTLRRGRCLIFHCLALIKGPRRVPALLLMFQVTRFDDFKRHNLPVSRATNQSDFSAAELGVRETVLK